VTTTCSACVHFKSGPAHPKFTAVCSSLGVRDYALAPGECFSPDPNHVARADIDIGAVGKMLRHLSSEQMQVFGHLVAQAAELERTGLKFGQPVYVNLGNGADGKDYLTSYFKGYVLGATQTPIDSKTAVPHVYLASNVSVDEEAVEYRTLLRMLPSSVLTVKKFQQRSAELQKEGRLESKAKGWKMPMGEWMKAGCPRPTVEMPNAYEPPTLDKAPASWLEPFSADELETVKVISKKAKASKRDTPEEVQRKQAQRAAARAKLTTTTLEDGTVVVSGNDSVSTDAVVTSTPNGWNPPKMPDALR